MGFLPGSLQFRGKAALSESSTRYAGVGNGCSWRMYVESRRHYAREEHLRWMSKATRGKVFSVPELLMECEAGRGEIPREWKNC